MQTHLFYKFALPSGESERLKTKKKSMIDTTGGGGGAYYLQYLFFGTRPRH